MKPKKIPNKEEAVINSCDFSMEKLLEIARSLIGLKISEIADCSSENPKHKGSIGALIERYVFGLKNNNKQEVDFVQAGVELKVIPVIKKKDGSFIPKERLSITMINYMKDWDVSFEESHLKKKINKILIIQYLHNYDDKFQSEIVNTFILDIPEIDLKIIQNDYSKIIKKILEGQAHKISEGDTDYLGAATKGAGKGKDLVSQPFSNEPAKSRVFSFKTSYLKEINKSLKQFNRKSLFNEIELKIASYSLEKSLNLKLQNYVGIPLQILYKEFNISDSNQKNSILVQKMLGIEGKINNYKEFKKANIIPKTIRVINNHIKESMSFKAINFEEINSQSWDQSPLCHDFESSKFAFFIFEGENPEDISFKKVLFWNMPLDDIEKFGKVYNNLKKILNKPNIVLKTEKGYKNIFPKLRDSKIGHIRPHGKNSKDLIQLPNGQWTPKQSFWLNNTYILKVIKGGKGGKH